MLPHHRPRRPPRSPLGLLRAFIVMRMKEIRSLRELSRVLNVDQRIMKFFLSKDNEKGYPSVSPHPRYQEGLDGEAHEEKRREGGHAPQEERCSGGRYDP